jgi:hypothetical protein
MSIKPDIYLVSFLEYHNNKHVREASAKQFVRAWGDSKGLPPIWHWCRGEKR